MNYSEFVLLVIPLGVFLYSSSWNCLVYTQMMLKFLQNIGLGL